MMRNYKNIFDQPPLAVPVADRSNVKAAGFDIAEERNRLANELHDTLAQAFAGILLHLEGVCDTDGTGRRIGPDRANHLACAKYLAKSGLDDTRRMLLGLRPRDLDDTTLAGGLKLLADRFALEWGIACKSQAVGNEIDLPTYVQGELYRVAQEALCNVRKHSRATSVLIFLNWGIDTISLTISDNGQGILAKRSKTAMEGFGLSSMRERALRIGGAIYIRSAPGRGTDVRLEIPILALLSTEN
jgi:signal transduction histidine kinase